MVRYETIYNDRIKVCEFVEKIGVKNVISISERNHPPLIIIYYQQKEYDDFSEEKT